MINVELTKDELCYICYGLKCLDQYLSQTRDIDELFIPKMKEQFNEDRISKDELKALYQLYYNIINNEIPISEISTNGIPLTKKNFALSVTAIRYLIHIYEQDKMYPIKLALALIHVQTPIPTLKSLVLLLDHFLKTFDKTKN